MPDKHNTNSIAIIISTIAAILGAVSVGLLGWLAAGTVRIDRDIYHIQQTRFMKSDFQLGMKETEFKIAKNRHDIDWFIRLQHGPKPD
jgi:hypothetical protein